MKIDLTEMMRLKGRLSDVNSEMSSIFGNINAEFESVSSNINSAGLHQSIMNVQEKIGTIAQTFSENMAVLEEFISQQLSAYNATNEDVKQSLEGLVNLINDTFDANGNMLKAVATSATTGVATAASAGVVPTVTTNKKADPTINDTSSYNTGAELQDKFATKIGNSDEKWEIVDTTYYYFKEKGLSDEQIAGIIGNMTQESALDLRCPTGQYQGLFQWGRDRYPSSWDVNTQLEHAWTEIELTRNNGKVLSNLQQKATVGEATESFAKWFEGYTGEMDKRKSYANAVYYYIKNNL